MTSTNNSKSRSNRQTRREVAFSRIADRIDLAIDVLTLGQYGLEQEGPGPAEATSCEGIGHKVGWTGWETRTQPSRRRGDCEPTPAASWDWPHSRDAISS